MLFNYLSDKIIHVMSLYLSYVSKNDCEEIISTARIIVNQVMAMDGRMRGVFFFLCHFAPYCLNFSARALTNAANHSETNEVLCHP